jgi:mannose-6-phosphate isomerase-like protein (cupin superfamily)
MDSKNVIWSDYLYTIVDIGGEVIKDTDTYRLKDNKTLNNLVVSSTFLRPGKETRGHSHKGQEEVYFFISGRGEMTLGEETFDVGTDRVVLIPDGVFHKVKNTGTSRALYFVCVFDGRRKELDYNKCDEWV